MIANVNKINNNNNDNNNNNGKLRIPRSPPESVRASL